MKKVAITYIVFTSLVLAITSCSSQPEENVEETTEQNTEATEQTDVKQQDSTQSGAIQCNGTIQVPQNKRIAVHSKTNGIVRNISVTVGQQVKKGQVLARLEHQDIIQLQENFLDVRSQRNFLQKEYARKKTLLEGKAISDREFEMTESEFLSTDARYNSLLQQLRLIGLSEKQVVDKGISRSIAVVAESNGIISAIPVHEGSFVSQNSALFELVDPSEKILELSVFSSDASRLHVGQTITFQIAGDPTKHTTKIKWIAASTENGKHSLQVTSEVISGENADLIVGSRVFAQID